MTTTTAVSGTGTAAAAAAAAAASGSSAADKSSTFQKTLESTVKDAMSLKTSTLGSMVATALDNTHVVAVSRPVTTSTASASAAGATDAVAGSAPTKGKGGVKIPDELRAYGNGKIPADALELIGIKKHKLWTVAAEAFKSMRAAAANDGVDIGVTDSYRPYDEQVDLAKRKGIYAQGGLAAVPGTSPHGWGMALDVDVTPAGLAWLRQHGSEFGFVEAVPREPWHWEYHGNK